MNSVYALKAWSEQQGYQFPLLADFWPHGKVAQDYGVFNDTAGVANRGTFLVDVDGVVRFAEMYEPGEAWDQGAWKHALAALPARPEPAGAEVLGGARSSAGEHPPYKRGVAGSNPAAPTRTALTRNGAARVRPASRRPVEPFGPDPARRC